MQKLIDGPDTDRPFLTDIEAAVWLGISPDHFRKLSEAEDWMRPIWLEGAKRWAWLDVAVLAYLYVKRTTENPRQKKKKNPDESQESPNTESDG